MRSRNLGKGQIRCALLERDDELVGEDIDSEVENHESEDYVLNNMNYAFIT